MLNLLKSQRKILVITFSMISPIISHSKFGSSSLSKHEFMHVLEYATDEKMSMVLNRSTWPISQPSPDRLLDILISRFYHRAYIILVHRLVQWDAL